MQTTVVLTTYNGIKYLKELLDSLRQQTREIDEVIVFDDQSKDNTVSFIKKYIDEYQLSRWCVVVNETNKGWMKNFRDGILSAHRDIVFPCDQDDIWDINKIEIMSRQFEMNADLLLLSSDYEPLYEEGAKKVDEFFHDDASNKILKVKPDEKFSIHTRPGCVMALRKTFAFSLNRIWKDNYAHDAFIWTAATLCDGNYLIGLPLIKYRRHDSNASTGMHRTIKNQLELMEMGETIAQWYQSEYEMDIDQERKRIIKGYLEWNALRVALLRDSKITNIIKLIKYNKYYRSFRQEIGDIYYLIRKR